MTSPDDPSERSRNVRRAIDGILDAPAAEFAAPIVAELAAHDAMNHDAQRAALGESLRVALAGRYAVERELGHGGMATVFLARDPRYDRAVAVKVLERDVVAPNGVERFLHEIRIAAGLTHPHVLAVHDSGEVDGLLYYVMPYVDGETLRARLTRDRPLPVADAVRLLRELADALAYAHAHGVVHRDLKAGERAALRRSCDRRRFWNRESAARRDRRRREGCGRTTSRGIALGTPAYMAPEQAVGDSATDYRADLYALGVVGYELLAGQHPFGTRGAQALVTAHLTETPAPLRARRADVPQPLESLILQLLAKNPADRPQSAAEVLRALDGLSSATVDARARSSRRRTTLAVLTVLVVVVAAAAAIRAYTSLHTSGGDERPSVAVLPLVSTSGDSAGKVFGDELADELIGSLGKVAGLRVAGRQSTFALRDKQLSPRAIADSLGVKSVVTGSVRRAGGRLKINVELVRASDAEVLFREEYDRALADVFAVQEEIARAVVDKLRVRLVAGTQRAPLIKRSTANLDAYDSYSTGRYILNNRGGHTDLPRQSNISSRPLRVIPRTLAPSRIVRRIRPSRGVRVRTAEPGVPTSQG